MNNLIEEKGGHGAIPIHSLNRILHRKLFRKKFKKTVKGLPFDWQKGFDVRDTVGPIAIKNQGVNSSCGGQSGSYFLEIQRRLQKITEGAVSAKSIYAPIAYPGGGTTVTDLIHQLCTKGANLESAVPSYTIGGDALPEYLMDEKSWITPQTSADSFTRAGYTPYDIKVDIDVVAGTIQDWGAVIMEVHGQNGHNPGWNTAFPQAPVPDNGNPIFAHFVCLIGAKMIGGKKYIIALESEGALWGEAGIQFFGEDYFKSGYIKDCFTLCYDERLSPTSDNYSYWAVLNRWFRSLWGI